jgi:hypothetical protein
VCRSAKFLSVTIKNVNKKRSILWISPIITYQIISFDVNLHASCLINLNFVKFIVKFKKFEHFIFLIQFNFFTGTINVKKNCYLCCACTNEIRFYSAFLDYFILIDWWGCKLICVDYRGVELGWVSKSILFWTISIDIPKSIYQILIWNQKIAYSYQNIWSSDLYT